MHSIYNIYLKLISYPFCLTSFLIVGQTAFLVHMPSIFWLDVRLCFAIDLSINLLLLSFILNFNKWNSQVVFSQSQFLHSTEVWVFDDSLLNARSSWRHPAMVHRHPSFHYPAILCLAFRNITQWMQMDIWETLHKSFQILFWQNLAAMLRSFLQTQKYPPHIIQDYHRTNLFLLHSFQLPMKTWMKSGVVCGSKYLYSQYLGSWDSRTEKFETNQSYIMQSYLK